MILFSFVILLSLAPLSLLGLVFWLAMRGRTGEGPTIARRFFQYLLLYALVVLTGEGVALLLAEGWPSAPGGGELFDQFNLARAAAQAVVGLPVLSAVMVWVRRTLRSPEERSAAAWRIYLAGAALSGLGAAAFYGFRLAEAVTGLTEFRPEYAANLAVWGTVWLIHFRLSARARHAGPLRAGAFIGALIGLWVMGWGIWRTGEQLLDLAFREISGAVGEENFRDNILRAASGAVIGGLIWVRYWVTIVAGMERDRVWRGSVWLAGALSGLTACLAGAWRLLTLGLEWLFGAAGGGAAEHFAEAPGMVSLAVIGAAVWFYTRRAVRLRPGDRRDEPDRLYDYVGAGLAFAGVVIGAAVGLSALTEWVLPAGAVEGEYHVGLAGGLGLLATWGPMWVVFWRRAQRYGSVNPDRELVSPVRRVYLVMLFGVGGLAVLGSLLSAAYLAAEDVLAGRWGWPTLDRVRTALIFLPVAGAAARYHQAVRRSDRRRAPAEADEPDEGVMMAVLVSAAGGAVAEEVEKQTGVRLWVWDSPQAGEVSAEQVIAAIDRAEGRRLLIVAADPEPRVIPFTTA